MTRLTFAAIPLLVMAACAPKPPLDTTEVDLSLTPEAALADMDRLEGTRVLWGGVIVAARNREESTRLEILGYPLNNRQRPATEDAPQRRFLAVKEGYLETADYAQGRQVTVTGPLIRTQSGRVGEATYTYPVVRIEDSHLWPKVEPSSREPRFHFGIGVLFGN